MDFVLYTEYLTESEIADEIAMETAAINLDRLFHAYNAVTEKAELDLRAAELKCFEESGDMDDLISLYEEAKEEVAEKEKGILSKIWEGIVNFFKRIKDFITGKKQEIDPNKKYGVPKGFIAYLKSAFDFVKTWLGNGLKALFEFVRKHPVVDAAAVSGLAVGLFLNKDKIKEWFSKTEKEEITGSEIITVVQAGEEISTHVQDFANKKRGQDTTEEDNKAASLLSKIASGIREVLSKLFAFIKVHWPGANKGESDSTEPVNVPQGETPSEKKPDDSNGEKSETPTKKDDNSASSSQGNTTNNKRYKFNDIKNGKIYDIYEKYLTNEKKDPNAKDTLLKFKKMTPKLQAKRLREEGFIIESTEDGKITGLSYISESGDIISVNLDLYSEDPFTDIFGESAEESILDQEGYAMEDTETLQEISEMVDELFV